MTKIVVMDTVGDSRDAIQDGLRGAGWEVVIGGDPGEVAAAGADAIVLATDAAALGPSLKAIEPARSAGAATVLVVDLDRSGWDRTFGSPEAFDVDAIFDKPVDAPALARRLEGILAARTKPGLSETPGFGAILDRAVANEEAAAAFYRQAAAGVTDANTRHALEGLMRDEEEHKQLIEEFRSGARPLPEGTTAPGSLVESFGTPDFSPDLSPADAFLLAAQKEKLAVEFYESWAKLYPEGAERGLLQRLAEIERRHKAKVEAMFSNAAFPESW
jgi:rubrerythrin